MDILDETSPFGARTAAQYKRFAWAVADAPSFPASVRRRLRKAAARLAAGPFDVTLNALRFRLYPAENYCDRIIWARRRLPEQAEHDALAGYVSSGVTFVDIGANIGTYSLYVAERSGYTARVLALEPHPRTVRKLAFNIGANAASGIEALAAAVGPERAKVDLWSDGGSNIGHSSLEKAGTSNPKLAVKVEAAPLYDLVAARGMDRIDLLKIDVEGFEDRALLPFFRSAPKSLWPKTVLIETVHRKVWHEDCLDRLAASGYRVAFATAENSLLVRP